MTPLRMMYHLREMCNATNTETPATIKAMANQYKVAANAAKDYDIEWYAKMFVALVDDLVAAGPVPWTPAEIKQQLSGRITNVVPSLN